MHWHHATQVYAAAVLSCAANATATMLTRSSRCLSSQPAGALVSSGDFCGRADGGACGAGAQEREFGLWGTFRMVLFHGLPRAKQAALASIASGSSEILLTNYDTLRWVTLGFDEACKSAALL